MSGDIINIDMPHDFPLPLYRSIHGKVTAFRDASPEKRKREFNEFGGGWRAVAYRYRTCVEHDVAFTSAFKMYGGAPQELYRYEQERELYGFFVSGVTVIDCVAYSAHAVGAMINPQAFPVYTPEELRTINPETTSRRFSTAYPNDQITQTFNDLLESDDYTDWKNIRDVLVHRSLPARVIVVSTRQLGPSPNSRWVLNEMEITDRVTADRREWLNQKMRALIVGIDRFVNDHMKVPRQPEGSKEER